MNEKLSFACDYAKGAHPDILRRMMETNMIKTAGYGLFFASPFWKKLQRKNGQPCMSKMDNVATGHPS